VMTDQGLAADDIKRIVVSAGPKMWGVITYPFAQTAFEAKYCFPFLLAAMALRRTAGRDEFRDRFILSEACVAFQKKVETRVDEGLTGEDSDIAETRLVIEVQDGRSFTVDARADYLGGPEVPLNDAAVDQKFETATAGLLPPDRINAVRAMLRTFETQSDAGTLLEIIGTITVPSL
jgi:2-methylcitrate dehydratase PrpD